eukprot:m.14629 g.14629  ORF g.14629 m.14629 type:complete len:145 (-) comp9226_c0_seq1:43-477(-)
MSGHGDQVCFGDFITLSLVASDLRLVSLSSQTNSPLILGKSPGNVMSTVFEIVPAKTYQARKAFDESMQQRRTEAFEQMADEDMFVRIEEESHFAMLRKFAEAEEKENQLLEEQLHGKPVAYNQAVLAFLPFFCLFLKTSTMNM